MNGSQARFFDQVADVYDQQVPFFATFGVELATWATIQPGDRVLDIACGRGAVAGPAHVATGVGGSVIAIDASTAMVTAAAAAVPGVRFAVMDAHHLALPNTAFDVVTCGFALHFLDHPHRVLTEIWRVLRPGGLFAWSEPAQADDDIRWHFYTELIARYEPQADPARRIHVSNRPVAQVATETGFTGLEQTHVQVHLPLAHPDDFWAWHQPHGAHALWLALPDHARESFRRELFDGLDHLHATGGIVLDRGASLNRVRRRGS